MNKLHQRAAKLIKQYHTTYYGENIYMIVFKDDDGLPIRFKKFGFVGSLAHREGIDAICCYMHRAGAPQLGCWLYTDTEDDDYYFLPDDVLARIVQALERRFAKRNKND